MLKRRATWFVFLVSGCLPRLQAGIVCKGINESSEEAGEITKSRKSSKKLGRVVTWPE